MKMEKTEIANAKKKSVWGSVGSGIVPVALAVCCVGHLLLLLALGGSSVWIGNLTALEPYRPIFVTLALAFLGLAFYRVYRKPQKASCAAGDSCAVAGPRRKIKAVLWILAVVIVALLAFPYLVPYVSAHIQVEQKIEAAQAVLGAHYMACGACALLFDDWSADSQTEQKVVTEQVVLRVQNISCLFCPFLAKISLLKLDGVSKVKATSKPPLAFVTYNPLMVQVEQLIEAATKAGFPSTVSKPSERG
jgi:mercuric ion transport protein